MGTDRLAQAVRHQLGIGRLLPLGGAADGAWLTERAARAALRSVTTPAYAHAHTHTLSGVRIDALRISLADPGDTAPPAVPAPPSALPPGPLRVETECAVPVGEPLPVVTERLRAALFAVAEGQLGLRLAAVDIRVTDLLDPWDGNARRTADGNAGTGTGPATDAEGETEARTEAAPGGGTEGTVRAVADAVAAVPGVARLAPVLGRPFPRSGDGSGDGPAHAVQITGREGRHVQVELAVAAGHRALDVARAARAAVATVPEVTVAILVTAVDGFPEHED
ncbi:hypothetical protein [Streptomyces daliensis]|uniref:Nucleopolyhedrovirus P10 family protein n=1 Tax=Streptomyces daliensis TaxID=299421 RepID=A0A8T4IPM8_9ACTN|nr:hypothetical protein [Streptomyces daliensis]